MKFPYGISDFKTIIDEQYFYCDRTDRIKLLENTNFQLFIRPRRFGKSLVLSMLENYYDVAKKDEFQSIFGHLKIGKNPTSLHNSYFILKFDFSRVDPTGSAEDVKKALFNHINDCIKKFILYYGAYDLPNIEINPQNAISTLKSLTNSVNMTPYPVYLLIDEYDNFANTTMMGIQNKEAMHKALVYDEGPFKTFFKAVKTSSSSSVFDRIFITGVLPVVMSDITSGFNIAEDIYFEPEFNDLCGFTQTEVEDVIKKIIIKCESKKEKIKEAVDLMHAYYNGYIFTHTKSESVYNPTLCLYFFKQFAKSCQYPSKMLDANLTVDESKLEYIAQIHRGGDILINLMQKDCTVVVRDIKNHFSVKDMITEESKDNIFLTSLLYYFGVLTIVKETDYLEVLLKVPNLVIKSLYVERIQKMLLPIPSDRDDGKNAAELVYLKGDMAPICKFMEDRYFKVFNNRDYKWANELTIKTAFLTLLYNDIIYIMDSETEINRKYTNLTMIIRPDKRYGKVFDVLIEFKFVTLKDAGVNAEKAQTLSEKDLKKIPQIASKLEKGAIQVQEYGKKLEKKYGNLKLQKFVVVALGFERVCFDKIDRK